MGIKVSRTVVTRLFEELNQEEQVLDRLRTKAQILIKPRALLVVEIDMKQLVGFNCLSDDVVEIQTRHLFVSDLWVHANHLRMIERCDETEHRSGGREINVTSWFIWFCFQSKLVIVALVDRVFAEKVQCFTVPLQSVSSVFGGIDLGTLTSSPEDVNMRAEFCTEIHRTHRLLQRITSNAWIV